MIILEEQPWYLHPLRINEMKRGPNVKVGQFRLNIKMQQQPT
ncbi:MAG: hypothetical protein ACI9LM_005561 [Alteromonadaceae bacterium]